jgi:hypothetical protein
MSSYLSDDEISNSSYYETESDNDTDELEFYEYGENRTTKYNIVLCEKYNENTHGISGGEINYHYLIHFILKKLNNHFISYVKLKYPNISTEIAECMVLPSGHSVCIFKTFWLCIIQRKWKKVYEERKKIITQRCNPKALMYRAMYGKWPEYCRIYPSINGMLNNLLR